MPGFQAGDVDGLVFDAETRPDRCGRNASPSRPISSPPSRGTTDPLDGVAKLSPEWLLRICRS